MDAAISVLASEGLTGMTFARIAERAGITPGLITYHFGTKRELLRTVHSVLQERLDTAMASRGQGAAGYLEALFWLVVGFVEHCAGHPEEMLALSHLPTDHQTESETDLHELAAMLREGHDHGEVIDTDPRLLAGVVLAAMRQAPADLAARPSSDAAAGYTHALASTLVRAVADVDRASVRRTLRTLARASF